MYILNESEIKQISGGYEQNLADALEVMSIFSTASGIAGGLIFGSLYSLETTTSASLAAKVLASCSGLTVVTLPMAIFTGIGVGATVGTVLGAGLYYSGVIFKEQ
jgi:hypothetical protein